MESKNLESLRYPIGIYTPKPNVPIEELKKYIQDITHLPAQLRKAVKDLSEKELDTPYRPGGWTVRQTVNHIADSHINSYTRFKLALTEDKPVIKTYEEHLWAELEDGKYAPVNMSLLLLEALHLRWVMLLESLTPEQWQRVFVHPTLGEVNLSNAVGLYSWHGQHHVAHITELRKRNFDR
ncbi:YfiT family bacillithiol transferase [Adhaeribacter radiodurans]|uniref:Bacillithiol transferase BstA n=1 Tax=Adhaeribacter radiodurans TaxID=2745197 RepID=A0A7L7L507_9BACT|nr:bacillithiol transferase BstA [Adhaeribacter radiodurans]QMU27888.1 bacillithiol transferase BstA [Adhaeribacter radiodurans]